MSKESAPARETEQQRLVEKERNVLKRTLQQLIEYRITPRTDSKKHRDKDILKQKLSYAHEETKTLLMRHQKSRAWHTPNLAGSEDAKYSASLVSLAKT